MAGGLIGQRAAIAQSTIVNSYTGPNSPIANPGPQQPLQTQAQHGTTNEMDVFQSPRESASSSLPQFFRYGPLQIRPHFDYRLMYATGLLYNTNRFSPTNFLASLIPPNKADSVVHQISPGLLIDIGRHWALNYTPTIELYSSDKFKNTVNHDVSLVGGMEYYAWDFGLSHDTAISSSPNIASGAQTDQTTHTTAFSASRPLNSRISTDLGFNQAITLVSGLDDTFDWNTLDWLNYMFSPRLNVGIGAAIGYVMVNGENGFGAGTDLDQTYQQLHARVNWRATDKVSFRVSGGFEDRQFMAPGSASQLAPLFAVGIQYQPFKPTQIGLTASRSVSSSSYYLAAQEVQTTSVSLSLDQGLIDQFSLWLTLAYYTTDYGTPPAGVSGSLGDRTDDQESFEVQLSHPFFKRGTWSVFYQYSDNQSSDKGFSFVSNQVGLELNYSF